MLPNAFATYLPDRTHPFGMFRASDWQILVAMTAPAAAASNGLRRIAFLLDSEAAYVFQYWLEDW